LKLPAMYSAADKASRTSQALHFISFASEFGALILIAIINVALDNHECRVPCMVIAVLLFALVAVVRRYMAWERKWYQSRALAESIKTTAWRFSMKAAPFDVSETDEAATRRFRAFLAGILKANRHLGDVISASDVGESQITPEMRLLRIKSVSERTQIYQVDRIENQQRWYSNKSHSNASKRIRWSIAIALVFILLVFSIFSGSGAPNALSSKFDSILVLCTALIGWVEVKRYGELAASYAITSQEISIIKEQIEIVQDETSLSEYVNETERAFSREHTQWLARSEVEI
jgi:hypothetical protein